MDDAARGAIEEALERALTPEELRPITDLSNMPDTHLDVMERLFSRNLIAAVYYMWEIAPEIKRSTLRHYAHDFDNVMLRRRMRPGLSQQKLYENELGRPLTAEEIVTSPSLEGIGETQRALTRELARKDRGVALVYLHDLVPSASSQARQLFLEQLPKTK